jgi:DNA-binding phage protein
MSIEPTPSVDPTDDLRTPEAIEAFIEAAAETGDIVYQCHCELIVERAQALGDRRCLRVLEARSAPAT